MLKIPRDKLLHFCAGLAISAVTAMVWVAVAQSGLVDVSGAWLAAVLTTGVAGLVKEKADYDDNQIHVGMHGVEALDALATLAGSVPVAALLLWGIA